ncbi:ArsR/SmtB family transcription factor [Flindersiella endophytica]
MLELQFSAQDVALTRFAYSPAWELVASVRILKFPGEHPIHRSWVEQVRERVAATRADLTLLADLVPVHNLIPAFVAPPPRTTTPDLETELAAMCAVSPDQVRASLDLLEPPRSDAVAALYGDPPAGLRHLAELMLTYWDAALAPYWPRLRTLCDGDVVHRAHQLAEGGAVRLFSHLHPSVSWKNDALRIQHRRVDRRDDLAGRGLLLTPSVFAPRVFTMTSGDWQPMLRYPPRGLAELWTPHRRSPGALAGILGRTRAALLAELDTPASTAELAARSGLTPGAISQHLGALHAAGLLQRHRAGRYVLYARTTAAEALLAAPAS